MVLKRALLLTFTGAITALGMFACNVDPLNRQPNRGSPDSGGDDFNSMCKQQAPQRGPEISQEPVLEQGLPPPISGGTMTVVVVPSSDPALASDRGMDLHLAVVA